MICYVRYMMYDFLMIYDLSWWYITIDDIWWHMIIQDNMIIYDSIWLYMILYDDIYDIIWWYMMIYDDIRWYKMIYDDLFDIWYDMISLYPACWRGPGDVLVNQSWTASGIKQRCFRLCWPISEPHMWAISENPFFASGYSKSLINGGLMGNSSISS